MTRDELKTNIAKEKEGAWSLMRSLGRADDKILHAFGYGGLNNDQAVHKCYQRSCQRIEKMILKWERENP